jgi:hypothetical protein
LESLSLTNIIRSTAPDYYYSSTAFVAEARQIIAEATNAKITGKASTDVVLFAYVFVLIVIFFLWHGETT